MVGDSKYLLIRRILENAGGSPLPGDLETDLLEKYLIIIGGTPTPGDDFNVLLRKIVTAKGGTPTPGDNEWNLLVKWLQALGECRACGDSVYDLWRKILENDSIGPSPEILVQQDATVIVDGQGGAVNFGSVIEGVSTVSITFTVFNTGDVDLTLGSVSVPAGYTLTEPLSGTITAGNNDTFTVRLDNAVVGVKSGNVSFSTNDTSENPFNFPITGTVAAAASEIRVQDGGNPITDGQAGEVSIGATCQSDTPSSKTFTVFNDGNIALTTSGLTVPTGYTISNPLAASIAPGGNDTFTVELDNNNPAGVYTGNISFANNDASENPFNFPITGEVTIPLIIDTVGADSEILWNGSISWFWPADCATPDPSWFGIELDEDGGGFGDNQFVAGSERIHSRESDGLPHTWIFRVAGFDEDFNRVTDWVVSDPFTGPA